MATKTKQPIVLSGDADPKKKVVKFDLTDEEKGVGGSLYIDNAKAGKTKSVRVTVELL